MQVSYIDGYFLRSMRLFEIGPDDESPYRYYVSATHKWSLPGCKCEHCGFVGSGFGIYYPHVDLPQSLDPSPYLSPWPVDPQRLRELVKAISLGMNPGLPVTAGTEFGPLRGKASGRFGDFAWPSASIPLLSEAALQRLLAIGVKGLVTVRPNIVLASGRPFRHLELAAEPWLRMTPCQVNATERERCPSCGQFLTRLAGDELGDCIHVDGRTFPKHAHLARINEYPGIVVASEDFMVAVTSLKLTDIVFKEIEVLN